MTGAALFVHRGRVEPGLRLGRLLHVPTANLPLAPPVPGHGTFAAVVLGLDRPYRAVAHVGVRPSVGSDGALILEAHLLDFEGDLYGRELDVHLLHRVADEVRCDSFAALGRKVAADVAAVRAWFAGVTGTRRAA